MHSLAVAARETAVRGLEPQWSSYLMVKLSVLTPLAEPALTLT